MAGHSKWANIKHRKQIVDSKKSTRYQAILNEIRSAASKNNNPATNFVLKKIIQKAQKLNIAKDAIRRALETKTTPASPNALFYEFNFAQKIALIIKVHSDNPKRVLSQIRRIIQKFPAQLLPGNSIRFLFRKVFVIATASLSETTVLNLLEKIDVQNVNNFSSQTQIILADQIAFKQCKDFLMQHQIDIQQIQESFIAIQKIIPPLQVQQQYQLFCQKLALEINYAALYDNVNVNNEQPDKS